MSDIKQDIFLGRKILILEDEGLLSILLEDMLDALGCSLAGAFADMDMARDFVEKSRLGDIDAAIIDVNIKGGQSFPLADLLALRHIPFAFSTGYGDIDHNGNWSHIPRLGKPFGINELKITLEDLFGANVDVNAAV